MSVVHAKSEHFMTKSNQHSEKCLWQSLNNFLSTTSSIHVYLIKAGLYSDLLKTQERHSSPCFVRYLEAKITIHYGGTWDQQAWNN
ncbi:MAG: hypothetical protein A2Z25_08000 [Planctomycetes bacterium RBG_16_55_9]|nr:MAG: hypothetical protein A2Z25_08000 [Planctomycetes bacterium RBG_16_55_9]